MPLSQRIAAIPGYVPRDLKDAAPGHRFQLYLENWQEQASNEYTAYKKAKPIGKDERATYDRESAGVLKDLCPLPPTSQKVLAGIRTRQQSLITHHGSNGYRISTKSTAPFATGLGNEHPIENGFAFLTPYGLPYLAGSGVKGILRRAAEELALENDAQQPGQWTWVDIWHLFGFEGAVDKGSLWDSSSTLGQAFARDLEKTASHTGIYPLISTLFGKAKEGARFLDREAHGAEQFLQACLAGKSLRGGLQCRGALDFWDVFPKPHGDKLVVEIMTPHYGKYYQGTETPHDSGAPIPVSFLAVPAKSNFDFSVVCQPQRLPESLQNQWRGLLDQAFAHAFEWVGFGAKTSVGYGAMHENMDARRAHEEQLKKLEQQDKERTAQGAKAELLAQMSPLESFIAQAVEERTDKNLVELPMLMGLMKQSKVPDALRTALVDRIRDLMIASKKWKEKSEKKHPEKDGDHQDTLKVQAWLKSQ